MGGKISEPHPSWKTGLPENERKESWANAAGEKKSHDQHKHARSRFARKANEDLAESKKSLGPDDKDRAVLTAKRIRLSKHSVCSRAYIDKPGNRDKYNAGRRARMNQPEIRDRTNATARSRKDKPGIRDKQNACTNARNKARAVALQAERASEAKANGAGRTTDFGLNDIPRKDELEIGAYNVMKNPAGLHPDGDATIANWIKDHGSKSIEEVLASGNWAAYFFTTKQKIIPGEEIRCKESTDFMSYFLRDPLWRVETHTTKERDFRRFTREEAKTLVRTYLLMRCISAYDSSGLEGALQRYIEDMGLPHGFCLHKKAGAGSRIEYGKTNPETTWVALSLIRVKSPTFADVDPSDSTRSPPLTGCQITSHDGNTTYKVAVCGEKQKFPDTKSVIADQAKIAAHRLQTKTRRKKRKADAISTTEDDKSSE